MLRPLTALLALLPPCIAQATPTAAGSDALQRAVQELRRVVDDDDVLGMVVMVARGDEVLVHEAFGHRDVAKKLPMQKDTLFRLASNTKAVTAAAVLTLVEQGKVGLDDPIARWFPTFAHDDAAKITVRQLLTHSSGLRIDTLFLRPLLTKSEAHPDAPSLVLECARFGEVGPAVAPGTTYSYSNPGYNLLAALVEVVSGKPFADYCRERFYEPLGMTQTCHHESLADNDRMAVVVAKQDAGWRVAWHPHGKPTVPFVRGSGGMIATTADFARFARLFVDAGRAGDRQLLAADSVRAATRDQIPHIDGHHYGFGWAIAADGSFAHSGSDGTFAWCDPSRRLVGLVFTQTQDSKPLGVARQRFRQDVGAAVPTSPQPGERQR
ncbi:MAG: beta-lactamase family protein [Planctomycetes bacterium]|nr:beta-lactamase family protein [Planctomycetota bacterium]